MISSIVQENNVCWGCGILLTKKSKEKHHFPTPKHLNGSETVDLCISCHDMVDRKLLRDWPFEWYKTAVEETITNRIGRLMLLKLHKILIVEEDLGVG